MLVSLSVSFQLDASASLNTLRPKGLTQIGMTSNGIALHRKLPEMVENGLTHLNISFVLFPSSRLFSRRVLLIRFELFDLSKI